MSSTQRYKLIDGTFHPDAATQVLLSLVKSKIDFHSIERARNHEHYGGDVTHSEGRIAELHQLHETLRQLCQTAAGQGQRVKVNGWIEVELVPDSIAVEAAPVASSGS